MFCLIRLIPALACIMPVVGCAMVETGDVRNYETVTAGPKRDTTSAVKHNRRAIEALRRNDLSEARFQADQALIANVNYAPAHNTLGRIQYCRKNYYLAAWEFEFAIRLQPEVAEYHNNLGLVYEASGKLPEATTEYQLAMDLASDDFNYSSNLARVRIRSGERTPETRELLEKVVFMDPRKEWKDWAQLLLNTTHLDIPANPFPTVVPEFPQPVFPPSEDVLPDPEQTGASDRFPERTLQFAPERQSDFIPDNWQSIATPPQPDID